MNDIVDLEQLDRSPYKSVIQAHILPELKTAWGRAMKAQSPDRVVYLVSKGGGKVEVTENLLENLKLVFPSLNFKQYVRSSRLNPHALSVSFPVLQQSAAQDPQELAAAK